MYINENSEKQGKDRAVTRPTLGREVFGGIMVAISFFPLLRNNGWRERRLCGDYILVR